MNVSRSVPPDCYLEDLERPGIQPPSPFRGASPVRRASSCRTIIIRDPDVQSPCGIRSTPDTRIPFIEDPYYHGRLPGTFDSLYHVQDTGVTPSPRSDTPLVLLPLQERQDRQKERIQSCISRRLRSSFGVRIGSNGDETHQPTCTLPIADGDTNEDKSVKHEKKKKDMHEDEDDKSVDSFNTAASSLSLNGNVCKICHCGEEDGEPQLITPCLCTGSLKYVHQECLHRWIKSSDIKKCELCKFAFVMQTKVKPLTEWEKLDMSGMERRKLCCSISFHLVAITCVVWSLYVLIDRTTEEIQSGELQWPFWTKLVVVAIGFTGGLVFMYIQCKVYIQICRKWRAYNRTIVVQDLPVEQIKMERTKIINARKPGKEFQVYLSDPELGNVEDTFDAASSELDRSTYPGSEHDTRSAQSAASFTVDSETGGHVSHVSSNESHENFGQTSYYERASPESVNTDTSRSIHAETQTQLRGITLENAFRPTNRNRSSSSNSSDISVVTISRLLEQMEGGGGGGGLVTVPAVIFFTEADHHQAHNNWNKNKHRGGPLSDPVLICDLPGHNQSPETNSNHPSSASGTCKSPTSASTASASTTSASTASGTARTASATESRDHEEDAN